MIIFSICLSQCNLTICKIWNPSYDPKLQHCSHQHCHKPVSLLGITLSTMQLALPLKLMTTKIRELNWVWEC